MLLESDPKYKINVIYEIFATTIIGFKAHNAHWEGEDEKKMKQVMNRIKMAAQRIGDNKGDHAEVRTDFSAHEHRSRHLASLQGSKCYPLLRDPANFKRRR